MSFATLEREILRQARIKLNNPGLKMADVMEWSSGKCEAKPDEVQIFLDKPSVSVCVKKEKDLRK